MDKKTQGTDKVLSVIYKQFKDDPAGQEMKFISTVFDFLNRRSTFLATPGAPKKVRTIVNDHINAAKKRELRNQQLNTKKTSGITPNTAKSLPKKDAIKMDKKINDNANNAKKTVKKVKKVNKPVITPNPPIVTKDDNKMNVDQPNSNNNDDDDDDNTVAPPGNGGKTDKYIWTQTLSEIEIRLDIDANLRGKHLNVKFKKKHLFISIKGKESTPIINGKLFAGIKISDSTWLLDKEHNKTTKTLTVIMEKKKGMTWWECVIIGDPKIDTSKIQPENSKLNDLDADTRGTVEKMMFDQRQKMKGLPTSKELEQQKILQKFKAQHPEMDFSNVKMG